MEKYALWVPWSTLVVTMLVSAIAGAKTREQGTSSELKFASKTALTGNLTEEFRFLFG